MQSIGLDDTDTLQDLIITSNKESPMGIKLKMNLNSPRRLKIMAAKSSKYI